MDTGTDDGRKVPDQQITNATDTRDILAHARQHADKHALDDYFIVDIDAHHVETGSWMTILDYVEDPVVKDLGKGMTMREGGAPGLLTSQPGLRFTDMGGRIPHQQKLGEAVDAGGPHRDVVLAQRAMQSFSTDVMVIFPTPMLTLGEHPMDNVEAELALAYNRWLTTEILPQDQRLKSLLYLPLSTPKMCLRIIEEFADHPSVIGFMVTSIRPARVHHESYMPIYAMLQERELPLGFHAATNWQDGSMALLNRFISMHALSFVHSNLIHITNWLVNGLPERFPELKVLWIESGLAWIPYLMQRLDNEYLMRSSEAPLLKRRPSDYMREMYYTCQPMERTDMDLLQSTFKAMRAETQLLYASDWPHWDFDTPSVIFDLPFLDETAKRNILGENARRIFKKLR